MKTLLVSCSMLVGIAIFVFDSRLCASELGSAGSNCSPNGVTKPHLREELLKRMERDQEVRRTLLDAAAKQGQNVDDFLRENHDTDVVLRLKHADSDNRSWLKAVVQEYGWPGKSLVGEDGAHAAWLIGQHANDDREFQENCLRCMNAIGPTEVAPEDIAYLTDRVRLAQGKGQLFGTQLDFANGKLVLKKVDDREGLNLRRQQIGMPSIESYLKHAEEVLSASVAATGNTESSQTKSK